MDATTKIALITSITSLVAVVLTPLGLLVLAWYQARETRKLGVKQIISPMRQAWIDSLRDRIAELMSEITTYHELFSHTTENSDKAAFIDSTKRIHRLAVQIELMLNAVELRHKALLAKMYTLSNAAIKGEDIAQLAQEFLADCKVILKEEWEVVKKEI